VGVPRACVAVTCVRLRPGHRQLADRARWLHDWHRQFETGEAAGGDDNIDDDSRDTCAACRPRRPRHWPAGYTVEFEVQPRADCDPVAFLDDVRWRLRALQSDAVRRSRADVELFRLFWLDSGLQVDEAAVYESGVVRVKTSFTQTTTTLENLLMFKAVVVWVSLVFTQTTPLLSTPEAPGCPGARPPEQHLYPQGDPCLRDAKAIAAIYGYRLYTYYIILIYIYI